MAEGSEGYVQEERHLRHRIRMGKRFGVFIRGPCFYRGPRFFLGGVRGDFLIPGGVFYLFNGVICGFWFQWGA